MTPTCSPAIGWSLFDLGDLACAWNFEAFALAFLWGLVFGVIVNAYLGERMRRVYDRSPRQLTLRYIAGAMVTFALTAWYLTGLDLSQTLAALLAGDAGWVRVLSRVFPHLAGAVGTGIGTAVGIWLVGRRSRRESRREEPSRPSAAGHSTEQRR